MVGLLPEGISDIIQKELEKIDLVRKDDIQNLLKNNLTSSILTDKDELSRIVTDSISEFKVSLKGLVNKTVEESIRDYVKSSEKLQETPVPREFKQRPFKFEKHKKKEKPKNFKFKKFDPKKKKFGFNDKRKKKGSFNKKRAPVHVDVISDSPVGLFLKARKPKDKMQELKLLAFYLDQVDHIDIYNVKDFHQLYQSANMKVPPVFDTLIRFLVKSDFLKVAEIKKEGFTAWKITDKVLKEIKN